MAVKIIIKRKVPKEKELELIAILFQLRSKALTQPGYISGETLRDMENPEEFLIISSWASPETWKVWQIRKERTEIQNKIDTLLEGKTEYAIYYYG